MNSIKNSKSDADAKNNYTSMPIPKFTTEMLRKCFTICEYSWLFDIRITNIECRKTDSRWNKTELLN